MKKQFLSILAAGLMLGGASQIKAMNVNRVPAQKAEYVNAALQLSIPASKNTQRPDLSWVTVTACIEQKSEIFGIRLYYTPSSYSNLNSEISFHPAIEPNQNETVRNYLRRLFTQRQDLLIDHCACEANGSTLVPLPDVKVAK